jgi:hypothetical protein
VFLSRTKQPAEGGVEERRRSVRHATAGHTAKAKLRSGREELCLLRDISAEGLRAEVYIPLEAGTPIEVELRTAHSAAGRVVWTAGKEIGVAFDAPIPAAAMLAHCSFDEGCANLRPPRLRVAMRGLFRIDAQATIVSIGNISQAGLQIAAPEPLAPGLACSITLPRLPARAANICWWRAGHAGLMLVEPFDYAAFAAWRAGGPV